MWVLSWTIEARSKLCQTSNRHFIHVVTVVHHHSQRHIQMHCILYSVPAAYLIDAL